MESASSQGPHVGVPIAHTQIRYLRGRTPRQIPNSHGNRSSDTSTGIRELAQYPDRIVPSRRP